MKRLLKQLAWGTGLCIFILSLALVGCGGAMEEATEEPAAEEPLDLAPTEPPLELAPTEPASGGSVDGGAEATDPSTATNATPTAVAPIVKPTPDFGSVAYDVPRNMVREKPVEVILLVSPSEDADLRSVLEEELAEVNQDPQNVTSTQVKVARYMFATLDSAPGDAFEIVPHQTEKQELSEDEPKQWEWTVIPHKGGTHRLILRIERVVGEGPDAESFKEEVHRDEVTVEVPFDLRMRDAVSGFDLKWLAGVFVFPLFFYILSRRDRNRE